MPAFLMLRGAPASGKTTWVERNGLVPFSVRSDEWKIRLNGYKTDEDTGRTIISHENIERVWEHIERDVRERMGRGDEIVILDSNNLYEKDMGKYVPDIERYGYDAYLVDFYQGTSLKDCLERNLERDPLRYCPEWAIHRFYRKADDQDVPAIYEIVSPEDALAIIDALRQPA